MSSTAPLRKRPWGITGNCLVLGYLAIAAFASVLMAPKDFVSMSPLELRVSPGTAGALISLTSLACGFTALTAAIGLWHVSAWAPRAFLAWVLAVCSLTITLLAVIRLPSDTSPLLEGAFLAFMAALFSRWWRYIQTVYARVGAL